MTSSNTVGVHGTRGSDWYTGETWCVLPSKQIEYQEKVNMEKMKKKALGPFFSSQKKG